MLYQRPDCLPQQIVFTILALQVEHVTPMLAMHSVADASGSGNNLPFQGREVACMHNGWLEPPQLTKQSTIQAYIIAGALVERYQFDGLIQALMKLAVSG